MTNPTIEQIARDAELLPCPFCGSQPFPSPQSTHGAVDDRQVWCSACNASGPSKESENLAIEHWNTRQACGQQQAVPEGYKLVPIEPTTEMLKALACLTVLDNEDMLFGLSTYAAMLAAVPTPPVQQAPTGWRDISSAPKHGIILVTNGNGTWPCKWDDDRHGFYELGRENGPAIGGATHWQPLPAAHPVRGGEQ